MEQGKTLEFFDYARRRMSSRGLTEAHVWFCMFHHDPKAEYKVGRDTVWPCVLPDGRNIKVRVEEGSNNKIIVKEAFTHL